MPNNKVKIINWLNISFMAIALVLECIPKSVEYVSLIGSGEYLVTGHWSYFGNPLHPVGLVTLIVAIITIVDLLLYIIMIKKDKLAITLTALVVSILALVNNCLIVFPLKSTTAYNIIILITYIIEVCLLIAKLWITESENKKASSV